MSNGPTLDRRTLRVTGQVQGVGFRPFVWRLAHDLGLTGTVRNDARGVTIEVQGRPGLIDVFELRLVENAPPLARVTEVKRLGTGPVHGGETGFAIVESARTDTRTERGRVTVDTATCEDCLTEMRDPGNRRHRHAFVNCTNCGPRYTIIEDLPYDRPLTTMAPFEMCEACQTEYDDPADRRFHAQPTCCPACGPSVRLVDRAGRGCDGDPFAEAARLLGEGAILTMKGLGGFHLVVDATREDAVDRLRRGKHRDHKPFAVLAADLPAARRLVALSESAAAHLTSPARPIVLAPRLPGGGIAKSVAPRNHRLGVMLPYTPMQHLLAQEVGGPLVMTSANHSDDPLLKDEAEIRRLLGTFWDASLEHDRGIVRAVDDSIVLDGPAGVVPLRRARGYAPAPLRLPIPARDPGLCVGGELKGTVAIVRGAEVVLSQHLGDLGYSLAQARFEQTVDDLLRLFDVAPRWIACDAHPDYVSHRWAERVGRARGWEVLEVQHHHAHFASLLAETGHTSEAIGVVCDGVGYGADGTAWGGELLVGGLVTGCERVGRLRPTRLPGGDAAARETGRVALSWLVDLLGEAGLRHPAARVALPDTERRAQVARLLLHDVNCPPSSGLGRLFDAVAALLGACRWNHHEAMSGMRLEALAAAARTRPSGQGVVELRTDEGEGEPLLELDHRPLLAALLGHLEQRWKPAEMSYFVHDAIADALYRAVQVTSTRTRIRTVALSGGAFANALLTELLTRRLREADLDVRLHGVVPPNDGGIAYGQAAVVAARSAASLAPSAHPASAWGAPPLP